MNKPHIGIVGLGGIARKVYLPLLAKEENWILGGAYTPNQAKRETICRQYRMESFVNLEEVGKNSDIVFVHSSTASHYEVVKYFLQHGKDVYVDKPLAATVEEAEQLVELSRKHQRKLMVGFNRRFAPFYLRAKHAVADAAWIRMDKHRMGGIGPGSFEETMLDDYLHLIDTARWLGNGSLKVIDGMTEINDANQLIYARHSFSFGRNSRITTGMHRDAGTGLELLEVTGMNQVIRVKNMDTLETESDGKTSVETPGSWETILEEKGFTAAVHHFVNSVIDDTEPLVNGEEALKTQLLLEELL